MPTPSSMSRLRLFRPGAGTGGSPAHGRTPASGGRPTSFPAAACENQQTAGRCRKTNRPGPLSKRTRGKGALACFLLESGRGALVETAHASAAGRHHPSRRGAGCGRRLFAGGEAPSGPSPHFRRGGRDRGGDSRHGPRGAGNSPGDGGARRLRLPARLVGQDASRRFGGDANPADSLRQPLHSGLRSPDRAQAPKVPPLGARDHPPVRSGGCRPGHGGRRRRRGFLARRSRFRSPGRGDRAGSRRLALPIRRHPRHPRSLHDLPLAAQAPPCGRRRARNPRTRRFRHGDGQLVGGLPGRRDAHQRHGERIRRAGGQCRARRGRRRLPLRQPDRLRGAPRRSPPSFPARRGNFRTSGSRRKEHRRRRRLHP